MGRLLRVLGLVLLVVLAGASLAFGQSPVAVPVGQLRLASPSVTWNYGFSTAHVCGGSGPGQGDVAGSVALSGNGQGDAQLTAGSGAPRGTVGNPYQVFVSASGGLQFTMSGGGPIPGGGTYTHSVTMVGYGTSFSGTLYTVEYFSNQTCYFTAPLTLTLAGGGLTFISPGQGQVDNTTAQIATNLQGTFNQPVNVLIPSIDTTFDAPSPGTIGATIAEGPGGSGYPGPGGSGYPVLVYEITSGPDAGSIVVVDDQQSGPGGSGYPVVAFDGSGSNGSSIFAPCSAAGDYFDCASPGGPDTIISFDGTGGSGSSILAPPTEDPGATNDTLLSFDGSGGSGTAIAGDQASPDGAIARAKQPKLVRLCTPRRTRAHKKCTTHPKHLTICIRRHKHSRKRCTTLKAVPVPFIATTKTTFTTAGTQQLHLRVSKAGALILKAAREADHLYHKHNPQGKTPPLLGLKIVVSYKPS